MSVIQSTRITRFSKLAEIRPFSFSLISRAFHGRNEVIHRFLTFLKSGELGMLGTVVQCTANADIFICNGSIYINYIFLNHGNMVVVQFT